MLQILDKYMIMVMVLQDTLMSEMALTDGFEFG